MARSLSYADAVRLLGGEDNRLLNLLNSTAGWIMAGTSPIFSDVLGWFDYKADLAQLSQRAIRFFYERHTGLSDYGNTDRIEAAHTVIVITGFFDQLKDVALPARLTRAEQVALGAGVPAMPGTFVGQIMSAGQLVPADGQSPEEFRHDLLAYYQGLAQDLDAFLDGLAATEGLSAEERAKITTDLGAVPGRAVAHYRSMLHELVGTFPAFAHWTDEQQHQATRADIAEMMTLLRSLYTGQAPDQRRAALAAAQSATLRHRAGDVGKPPDGVTIPSLEELYITPRFRVFEVTEAGQVSDEAQWVRQEIREDPWQYLGDHLQSEPATRTPTCIVADCGGGKTSFIRMFAAVFPPEKFLVLPATLRENAEIDGIRKRLEQAIFDATGENLTWPALVASAGDARPVVVFDGFDELLHATGANKTGFLERVAVFQRQEAALGRPVAVVVTSRTSVADRARIPEGSLALRLEPFGEPEISAWLAGWNALNPGAPLTVEDIRAYRALAGQPLLLVMLALHAAGHHPPESGPEHVINLVATREITKYESDQHDRDLREVVQDDLRALTAGALAMFQRATGRISEDELNQDLTRAEVKPHRSLRPAEDLLIRFPFRRRGTAFEFSYTAFADVLVARLIWTELEGITATDPAALGGTMLPNDTALRRLLSTRMLDDRQPVVDFLTGMATTLTPSSVVTLRDRLTLLFRTAHDQPMPSDPIPGRRPPGGVPFRYAVYRANLLLILVNVTGDVLASSLFEDHPDVPRHWHGQALFWESQLPDGNSAGLVHGLSVQRIGEGDHRDVRIELAPESWRDRIPPPPDEEFEIKINFRYDPIADSLMRTAGPLRRRVGAVAADVLMRLWTAPSRDDFHRCLHLAVDESQPSDLRLNVAELSLPHLGPYGHLGPGEAVTVLEQMHQSLAPLLPPRLQSRMVLCALAHLDQGEDDERTARVLRSMLEPDLDNVDVITAAMAMTRLAERGFALPTVRQLTSRADFDAFTGRIGDRRPGLVRRLAPLAPDASQHSGQAG
ncbi:NACHT domain-containing protein [Actinoplanes sp. NPDC020271]|uniref:NACHT domain-containing protein n=1 Tax=Actinoplanes sp. NPDC020271 TaxID=3363896 RepID=UPI0037939287